MLKKRIDDEFEAQLPGGVQRFFIVAVEYASASGGISPG
jgi:transcription elongation factor GreB